MTTTSNPNRQRAAEIVHHRRRQATYAATRRPWTAEEDVWAATGKAPGSPEWAPALSTREVADHLKRTVKAVLRRRDRLRRLGEELPLEKERSELRDRLATQTWFQLMGRPQQEELVVRLLNTPREKRREVLTRAALRAAERQRERQQRELEELL